jgi:hypothetical protein
VQTLKSEDRLLRSQRLLQRTDCVLTVMRTLQRFLCVQVRPVRQQTNKCIYI